VGQSLYVWGFKGPNVLLRWYDYAMGHIRAELGGNKRLRCTVVIISCTGEIKKPGSTWGQRVMLSRSKEGWGSGLGVEGSEGLTIPGKPKGAEKWKKTSGRKFRDGTWSR